MYSARNRGSLDDPYNDVSSESVFSSFFLSGLFSLDRLGLQCMTSYSMSMDKIEFKSISQ